MDVDESLPQSSRPFRLRVERGADAGRTFALAGVATTIGRVPGNAIILNDTALSRFHAQIDLRDGGLIVTDLGSTNGTRVNGQRVHEPTPLHPGDALTLGQTLLRVEHEPASIAPGPATTRPAPALRQVYRTEWHPRGVSSEPVYEIRGQQLFRTSWHQLGTGRLAEYAIRGPWVYRTPSHQRGAGAAPDYELRGNQLFRTSWHEHGASSTPDYELR